MSDNYDIVDRLFHRKTWLELEGLDESCADVQAAIIEIDRLRAEVAALKAERDEARREVCQKHEHGYFMDEDYAEVRGWDCFDAEVQP